MEKFGLFIERLFEEHKLIRRLLVLWAVALITWVITTVFSDLPLLTGAVAAALATVIGLLTVVVAFYQWSRQNEDKQG
jgi:ABC-type sugar transport system permease subunit